MYSLLQDKAQLVVAAAVKELTQRLSAASDALLALPDEDLLEERERAPANRDSEAGALSSPTPGKGGNIEEGEEGEEAFAARVALLRVRCMLLASSPGDDETTAALQMSLGRLLTVRLPSQEVELAYLFTLHTQGVVCM